MASFSKRVYQTWRVIVQGRLDLKKTFEEQPQAQAYAAQLKESGVEGVQVKPFQSSGWQARIRSKLAPALNKTFATKAMAQEWAQAREGEIVKRQFVDYREAERYTLGGLLQRFDTECLAKRDKNHPDRARIRKICRHTIARIPMSTIQPGDFADYRNQRLKGGYIETGANADSTPWAPVKGTSVKRELDLMSGIISHARSEWKIYLAMNPATATNTSRPEKQAGDERDRRLADLHQQGDAEKLKASAESANRSVRQRKDVEYEHDPEITDLLTMPQTEQQALLRACRYPDWFRPRKKTVTPATVLARSKKKQAQRPVKARLRKTGNFWAVVSFAIETAMRRGEMCKLQWQHVHLGHGDGYLELPGTITKNKKSRIVTLSHRAMRILLTRKKVSEFVFDTNENTIKLAFKRAKERVQVADLRLHDLRHEATSRLFEETTLRAEEIGHITGHTDPRMLQRYYNLRPKEFVNRVAASRK